MNTTEVREVAARAAEWWEPWALTLRNLLLPVFCKQCGNRLMTEENGYFCPTCWEMSSLIERPFCDCCGRPHVAAAGFDPRPSFTCADCRERTRLPYRRIYGAAVYTGAVEEAIKLFKFNGKRRLATPLGALMAEFAQREMACERYGFVVPVPLHKVRERERGYNQSRLLAERVLECFPNAHLDESLLRIRPTRVQSKLTDPAGRRANVKGAFAVRGAFPADSAVLLIDDVVTTGGTVHECAAALRRAGAGTVDVFAAALALPHHR